MITSLTYMIVLLGSATVGLSLYVAYAFLVSSIKSRSQSGSKLTAALLFQLLGEAALGGGTLLFAVLAHTGHLPNVPVSIQSLMRLTMFAATALTTIHLYMVVKEISGDE